MKNEKKSGMVVFAVAAACVGLFGFYFSASRAEKMLYSMAPEVRFKIYGDDTIYAGFYHPDEGAWMDVGLQTFKEFFVMRDYSRATWMNKDFGPFGTLNPNVAKFLFGGTMYLNGIKDLPSHRSENYNWSIYKTQPPIESLVICRRSVRVIGAIACTLVCVLAWRLFGSALIGLMSGLLFAASPLVAECSSRVWLDMPAVFFALIAMIVATWCIESRKILTWIVLGLAIGVAVSTKMNTLLLVPVVGAVWFFNLRSSERRDQVKSDAVRVPLMARLNKMLLLESLCFALLTSEVFAMFHWWSCWTVFGVVACLWYFRERRNFAVTVVLLLAVYAEVLSQHVGIEVINWPCMIVAASVMVASSWWLERKKKSLFATAALGISFGLAMATQCGIWGLFILVVAWQFPKFHVAKARQFVSTTWDNRSLLIAKNGRMVMLALICFVTGVVVFIATNPFLWNEVVDGIHSMLVFGGSWHNERPVTARYISLGRSLRDIWNACFAAGTLSYWTSLPGMAVADFALFWLGIWASQRKKKSLIFVIWAAVYLVGVFAWVPLFRPRWYLPLSPVIAIGEAVGAVYIASAFAQAVAEVSVGKFLADLVRVRPMAVQNRRRLVSGRKAKA